MCFGKGCGPLLSHIFDTCSVQLAISFEPPQYHNDCCLKPSSLQVKSTLMSRLVFQPQSTCHRPFSDGAPLAIRRLYRVWVGRISSLH